MSESLSLIRLLIQLLALLQESNAKKYLNFIKYFSFFYITNVYLIRTIGLKNILKLISRRF